ncbi:MAG: ethanolamine ammonia-lyase subunit EutC [Synergistaceae bacterium]
MTNDAMLKDLIKQVIEDVVKENNKQQPTEKKSTKQQEQIKSSGEVPDISAIDFRKVLSTPDPENPADFMEIKATTSARLGVWRAGPRCTTTTHLRFLADHAAAMDAVFNDISEEVLEKMQLKTYTTVCETKDEFLTRPDLGCQLSKETVDEIKKECVMNPDVQVYFSDGLSTSAVENNLPDLLPAVMQGLKANGLKVGTPFYLKYGRVRAMDAVTEAVNSKVTIVFLGERPGLATSSSLSGYMTYEGYIGAPETIRNIVSNIYAEGTNPVEAGAHIADIIKKMIDQKASGLKLKL